MSDKWVTESINRMVALGGERVSEAEYLERVEICKNCEFWGKVSPLPFIELDGCTLCGCPTETKPRFKNYFSVSKLKIVDAECPHPDGNKWLNKI